MLLFNKKRKYEASNTREDELAPLLQFGVADVLDAVHNNHENEYRNETYQNNK